MKNLVQQISILLLIVCTSTLSSAQAWVKDKEKGFYKLDFASIRATDIADAKGAFVPFRPLGNYTTSFYGEYGISDKLTLLGYVPFWVRNSLDATKNSSGTVSEPALVNNSFGDVDLGFRYRLYNKNGISISANLFLGLPTGNSTQKDGLITGDGEFNQMLKIAVGTGKTRWWTQGALGFNNRTKSFSDEIRYDFEFGYKFLNDRFLAILKINGVESLNNGTAKESPRGLFSNNVEYLGLGPEFLYYVNKKKNLGVSLRIGGALKAQNILAAPSIAVGVFSEF
ncbi:MAG: hypothetical protein U5L45_05115 [Saprospiraceae bacterium]|nr:hypothetical protein [Saprospiraceae bacterium]